MPPNGDEAPTSSAVADTSGSLDEHQQCVTPQRVFEKDERVLQEQSEKEDGKPEQSDDEEVQQERESAASTEVVEVPIEKTEKGGFGIYFTKRETPDGTLQLVVDGFVEDTSSKEALAEDEDDGATEVDAKKNCVLQEFLQLEDALVGVNGVDCQQMEVMEMIALLRAAPLGSNTLQFSREPQPEINPESDSNAAAEKKEVSASITKSFIGALRKVKTKIKEGIEGDEKLLLREQEEKELFEKSWLAEFDRLKHEYETKWETCTYTADEFCGLLYHSGDQQQKEYLLREYPLLIESWKDANLSAASLRVRPDWPVPKVSYAEAIEYHSVKSSYESSNMGNVWEGTSLSSPPPQVCDICCSPPLHRVLDTLRHDFTWRRSDVLAFEKRLEAADILSCSDLVDALEVRSGFFERSFQCEAYPRLTKAISRAFHAHARHLAKTHEDLGGRIGGLTMKQQQLTTS